MLASLEKCIACPRSKDCNYHLRGVGNIASQFIIVALKPDGEDDLMGEPFSGKTGDFVKKILKQKEMSAYLTYLLKCWSDNKIKKDHINSCAAWFTEEVRTIKPKVIMGLGKQVNSFLEKRNYLCKMVHWHDLNYILNGNKKLLESTLDLFDEIKGELSV